MAGGAPGVQRAGRRRYVRCISLRTRLSPALRDAFGATRELEHWEAGAVDFELVGPAIGWREKTSRAEVGDVIVLLDSVAADAQSAGKRPILVKRRCGGEEDDAALDR